MSRLELWSAVLLLLTAAVVGYALWRGRRGESSVYRKMDYVTDRLEELTLRVVGLELNLAGYRVWNARLRGQVVELGGTPVPPPSWLAVDDDVQQRNGAADANLLVAVYHLVNEHFNSEDISDLAFQANIDPEAFGGDGRSARARQLVEHAYRTHQLPQLVRVARRLRPLASWPPIEAITKYQSALGKE